MPFDRTVTWRQFAHQLIEMRVLFLKFQNLAVDRFSVFAELKI
jgi:hypothetical protein